MVSDIPLVNKLCVCMCVCVCGGGGGGPGGNKAAICMYPISSIDLRFPIKATQKHSVFASTVSLVVEELCMGGVDHAQWCITTPTCEQVFVYLVCTSFMVIKPSSICMWHMLLLAIVLM